MFSMFEVFLDSFSFFLVRVSWIVWVVVSWFLIFGVF